MKVSSKVVVAILNQYIDVAVNSIHGDTIYLRDIPNGIMRVTTFEDTFPISVSGNNITVENGKKVRSSDEVICYSFKVISGFSIVDVDRKEIIFGIRYEINDIEWIITSASM